MTANYFTTKNHHKFYITDKRSSTSTFIPGVQDQFYPYNSAKFQNKSFGSLEHLHKAEAMIIFLIEVTMFDQNKTPKLRNQERSHKKEIQNHYKDRQ